MHMRTPQKVEMAQNARDSTWIVLKKKKFKNRISFKRIYKPYDVS